MSDRIFGLVVLLTALAFIASATQVQTSFLQDPVGPKAFPMAVGLVAGISGLVMIIRPDPDPVWPVGKKLLSIFFAVVVMVVYAYALKPLGFLIPTAITAAILSYQISPKAPIAAITGIGLSILLFLLFKYALGLGLVPLPQGWIT